MPKFNYTAKDNAGKNYKGSMQAAYEDTVRRKLTEAGLYIIDIKKERKSIFQSSRPITSDDLVTFTQQLADLIDAGIPLLKSLSALQRQTDNPTLKEVVKGIEFDIEAGSAFSEALGKHSEIFSEFYISMIKAGEKGGVLSKILDRLAIHLERKQELKQKIKSAFAYPVLVGILALLVVTFLVIVVVPIFAKVYKGLNIVLPGPTLALIFISNIVRRYWWAILFFIGALFLFYREVRNKSWFRDRIDLIKIKIPIFGKLNRMAAVSRFVRTFGDMLSSGITALESLDVAGKVVNNSIALKIVEKMKISVSRGNRVTEPLEDQSIFPPATVQMMMAGEESGTLDKMLEKNANTLDRDVDHIVRRIVTMIEPLMTAILAVIVGFIAMAIYFPIFDLISQISHT